MTKFMLWMLLLWMMEVMLVGSLVHESWIRKVIAREHIATVTWLGDEAARDMKERADRWFKAAFMETGLHGMSYDLFIPTEEERKMSVGMENLGQRIFETAKERLDVIWTVLYQVLLRLSQMLLWAPYFLLILIPAAIDGLLMRQIKKHGFGHASSFKHRYGLYAFAGGFYTALLLLFIPLSLPPLTVPLIGALMSAGVGVAMANIQKRI